MPAISVTTNLYRAVFDRVGDAIFIVDPAQDRFIDVSDRACELLGYTHSELMRLGPTGVHPDEIDRWKSCVAAAVRNGRARPQEISCKTSSGELLPAEMTAAAIEIDGRQCVIFSVRDMSERQIMEQALRESEERYRNLVEMSPDAILVNQDGIIVFVNPAGAKLLGADDPDDLVGRSMQSIVAPEYRNVVKERFRRVHDEAKSAPPIEVELIRLDGSRATFEGIGIPITFQGKRAAQVVLRDFSEHKQMEQESSALAEIGAVLGGTLEIEEVYDRFADLVSSLLPFDRIAISEFDLVNETISPVYIAGLQVEGWEEGVSHPISASRLSPVMHNREALIFDAESTERHAQDNPDSAVGAAAGLTTGIAVPLSVRDEVIGVLNLSSCDRAAYSSEHLELALRVGNQIAPAVENARLYKQAGEIAALEERNRLARDLHDSVTQSLYSLTLYSEASMRNVEAGRLDQVQSYLSQLNDSALQALKEMRLLVYQLRPPILEDEGLVGALQHRLDAVERRSGIRTRLLVDHEYLFPADTENALFRVALEALNNTIKHADASAVEIKIAAVDEGVELSVVDNGRGFALADRPAEGGIGLASMKERLDGVGGSLSVASVVGQGTTVRAVVSPAHPNIDRSDVAHEEVSG